MIAVLGDKLNDMWSIFREREKKHLVSDVKLENLLAWVLIELGLR